ncbi:MAG: restriction endonuclease subunit S [Desulfotalea sp.]
MSWEKFNFIDICEVQGGTQPPKSEFIQRPKHGYIQLLQIQDFKTDKRAVYVPITKKLKTCQEDDILIGRYGASIGKILTGKAGAYNVAIVKTIPNKRKLTKRFLFYYLSSPIFQNFILNVGGRAAQAGFNKNDLAEIEISLPPRETQTKIVALLDQAQSLVGKRKEQIELMDSLTQSLFYDMFGDPVINPKGWGQGTIRDLAVKTQYGTSKKSHLFDGDFPVLRMNNITYSGGWDFTKLKYTDFTEKEQEKFLVYKGQLLFNRTNSKELVGKTAVYKEDTPVAFAGYLVKLITNSRGHADYISAYLNSKHGKSVLFNKAKNIVGMANINAEELKDLKINIPPMEQQNLFAKRIEKIEAQKQAMTLSLKELKDNFNSLMQRAFKGELDI